MAPNLKPPKLTAAEKREGREYMAKVAQLPCCICAEYGMTQRSRTEVHHCKSGRYSNKRAPDTMTIPLCHSHHNKLRPIPGDEDKIGYHNNQKAWESAYGPDTDWLSWVENQLDML